MKPTRSDRPTEAELRKLLQAADAARERVSGYSDERRAELEAPKLYHHQRYLVILHGDGEIQNLCVLRARDSTDAKRAAKAEGFTFGDYRLSALQFSKLPDKWKWMPPPF